MLDQLLAEAERFHRAGRAADAANLYQRILRNSPRHFAALCGLGRIYLEAQQFDQSRYLIGEALKLEPGFAEGHCLLGVACYRLGRTDEALASLDKAVSLKPDFADAIANRAMVLLGMTRFEEALAGFDRALELNPDHAVTWNNRGTALLSAKCYLDALMSFDKALSIWPEFSEAKANRANVLKEAAQSTAAHVFAGVLCARGLELMERRLHKEALACFEDALAVKAGCAAAISGREQARRSLAKESYTSL